MKKEYILYIFLIITPLIQGLYFEYSFCFANAFLLGYLLYLVIKNKKIYYRKSPYLYILLTLPIIYALTGLVAIDKGMNIYGIMKVLEPFALYMVLSQMDIEENTICEVIAVSGIIMSIFGIAGMYIESIVEIIIDNNRMSGFMGYANTYALYMLVTLICLSKTRWNLKIKAAAGALLIATIIITYSRSVYVIAGIIVAFALIKGTRRNKLVTAYSFILGLVIYFIVVNTSGAITLNQRVAEINPNATEFQSRLLYYIDAIKIVGNHLFGLGYDGYFYIQGKYQTGIYNVRLVHNSILQISLEIGILGVGAYLGILITWIKNVRRNKVSKKVQLIFYAIIIHSIIDFDLTFLTVTNILVIMLYFSEKKHTVYCEEYNKPISKSLANNKLTTIMCILVVLINLNIILGISALYSYISRYDTALFWYKYNTEAICAKASIFYGEKKYTEASKYIERAQKLNKSNVTMLKPMRDIHIKYKNLEDALQIQRNIIKLDGMNIDEVEKYSDILLEILLNTGYNRGNKTIYKEEILGIRGYIERKRLTIGDISYKQKAVPVFLMTKKLIENENNASKY